MFYSRLTDTAKRSFNFGRENDRLAQTQLRQRILIYYMTHPIYTESALAKLSVSQLAEIANELGAIPTGDRQQRDSWVQAILVHQSTITKVSIEVPTDLIEEKTLELLGVEIVDREDYDDLVVPHGDIRFWLK